MKVWFELFDLEETKDVTLAIKGNTFKRSDCVKLGGGTVKVVYKVEGQNQCFFLPKTVRSADSWNAIIRKEKYLLDQIIFLGLKAQEFEIVPVEIKECGKTLDTINVLLTRDFKSLCKEESLALYNHKDFQKITGEAPDFIAMREKFKDPFFVREMFKKIIKEYAVAFTFSLPISVLQSLDDSEHYLFELPKDPKEPKEPPVVRYMFWDVMGDFGGVDLPMVPTLNDLKSATKEGSDYGCASPIRGLRNLANSVACTMYVMNEDRLCNNYTFVREVEADIQVALNQDDFLSQALDHAKNKASEFLNQKLNQYNDHNIISNYDFVSLMCSAISTANVELVTRVFQLHPMPTDLSAEDTNKIMSCAKKYDDQAIVGYLNTNLVSPSLKRDFLQKYNAKLLADQGSWCGIYSFFTKSYVSENTSLEKLVLHAQGLSERGSGKRSLAVMKEMGWLNENNQLSFELSNVLKQ